MCGIAGIASWNGTEVPSTERLRLMAGSLRHRGPDAFGLYRDHLTGLAHARLSIIDLKTGQQPMCNEDRTLWIVFNGEIFNYVELRDQLLHLGHAFRTRSDTEVILHAYEEWGNDAFLRFNGQFALALWDTVRRELVLARDRYGIHPLFVHDTGTITTFASEVKAIFATDRSIRREFDPIGLDETFTFWSPLAPRTIFRDVSQVPPGHVWIRSSRGLRTIAFAPHTAPHRRGPSDERSIDAAAEAVREALGQATRLRILRSDVPVGCYLSGGLDSSIIAALGYGAKGDRLRTFSLRFEDDEYDETAYQQLMAAHLGSDHREVRVTRRDIANCFPEIVRQCERPLLRTAPAPLYLLSRLVRESGIKVVLTGEGADEIFAGYDIFREAKVRRFWAEAPTSTLRPMLLKRLYPYLERSPVALGQITRQFFGQGLEAPDQPGFSHIPRWISTRALQRLFSHDLRASLQGNNSIATLLTNLPPEFSRWAPLTQDQYLEIRTLLAEYLLSAQGDRMLMAHSIEGRYPFLDPEVASLAESLPPSYKLHVLDEKHVLKRAAKRLLPEPILQRKKQPYRAPDAQSFLGPDTPEWVDDIMTGPGIRKANVFDPDLVSRLWKKCKRRNPNVPFSNADNMGLIGVLSTQILFRIMIEESPSTSASIHLDTLVDRVQT